MNIKLNFKYLPSYAGFLLKNKQQEFAVEQLKLLRELKASILNLFQNFSDEELIASGTHRTEKFLESFRDNKAEEYLEISMKEWLSNKIPLLTKEKLLPEDISLISFTLRSLFRNYLPSYTTDSELMLKIMEEFDRFTVELDTLYFKKLLEIQHRFYEQAEALAHIGNWNWDLTTKHLTWSEEMFRIYELEHVSDASIYDPKQFTHPEDISIVDREMERSVINKMPHDFFYRIISKKGTYKYVHAKGQPDADSPTPRMFGTLQDVTEQKEAEEELKRSEERYHAMVNEVQDYAILLLNKDGLIENWNKGAEKIKGYTEAEAVGKHFRLFYTQEDRDKHLPEQLLNLAATEGKATHEGWRMKKDGSVFWGNIVITTLYDKNKNIIGYSKVTRDLSDKKIAEDRLKEYAATVEQKNKKLEQANKELESFSYIASHDLQEPLRKIQAFTSRLLQKESGNLSDWGKDVFNKVQMSANRMQKLIEALLNFSRLDKTQESFELVDTNLLFLEIKNSLNDQIEPKNAIIEADQLPMMNVIPVQFTQLLTNLLSNSIKYSKENVPPHIRITYGLKEGKNIPGNIQSDRNKYHHITIIDNGIGFEQQYAEKIFELFQRLHGKSEYEGTGIGLSICKKIVENHKGFIYAKGESGKGAEFNIFIPSERKTELISPL